MSAFVDVNVPQLERSPDVCKTLCRADATIASTSPDGPTASASGVDANGSGISPGDHLSPPSALWATGENFRSAEIKNPTVSEPEGAPDSTSPPLLATPGGVRRTQDLLPAGLRKTSQNVLLGSSMRPMGIKSDDPDEFVIDALIGTEGAARTGWYAP